MHDIAASTLNGAAGIMAFVGFALLALSARSRRAGAQDVTD